MAWTPNSYAVFFPFRGHCLVYNSLSGDLFFLSKTAVSFFEKIKREEIIPDNLTKKQSALINFLVKKNLLFPSFIKYGKYQEKQIKIIGNQNREKNYCFAINVTDKCNLSCPYCINSWSRQKVADNVYSDKKLSTVFEAIDHLSQKDRGNIDKTITLFGGEPLACLKSTFEKITKLAQKRDLKLSIITNGTLITSKAESIKKYKNIFNHFQVTLDGPEKIHNRRRLWGARPNQSFRSSIEGLQLLINLKIPVVIRTNIDKKNITSLPKLLNFYQKSGWINKDNVKFSAARVYSNNYAKIPDYVYQTESLLLGELIKLAKKDNSYYFFIRNYAFPQLIKYILSYISDSYDYEISPSRLVNTVFCGALTGRSLIFSPDGNIYSCLVASGVDEFRIGRYFPSFSFDRGRISFLKKRNILNLESCQLCPSRYMCQGGCPYSALMKYGNINKAFCEISIEETKKIFALLEKNVIKD